MPRGKLKKLTSFDIPDHEDNLSCSFSPDFQYIQHEPLTNTLILTQHEPNRSSLALNRHPWKSFYFEEAAQKRGDAFLSKVAYAPSLFSLMNHRRLGSSSEGSKGFLNFSQCHSIRCLVQKHMRWTSEPHIYITIEFTFCLQGSI
jgi:hypothetical protein